MSLISRLNCVLVLGAGSGMSLAFGTFSGEQDKWGEFVFSKSSASGGGVSRTPILSCSRGGDNIQIFLVTKKEQGAQEAKVYLMGEGFYSGRKVNFEDKTSGHQISSVVNSTWSLKVWKDTKPGYTELLTLEDDWGDENDISCNRKDVFQVNSSYSAGNWEQSVDTIRLTLSNCRDINGAQICDIVINTNGLQFNPKFKPKAILK